MEIKAELKEVVFLARDNRFRATVEVDGGRVWAYSPNSGRLVASLLRNEGRNYRSIIPEQASKRSS